ncbi:hypothetical protein VNO77_07559 [Canavalia gladiata]|uniref:Uncharacterized protein n=1 Tax=Canavalia gladiata TaxID=3824 RepID=A0AAN9M8J6_CANGL
MGNLHLSTIRKDLVQLDISNNNISGFLPNDIGSFLPRIMSLNLSMNNFEGNIPTSIGEMHSLMWLDLSHNHFSGELPQQLETKLFSLEFLKLSNNLLQGKIVNFSNFSNLYILYLNNNITGTIKEVLANLNSEVLRKLDISNNSISGEIPNSIGKFSSLSVLLMAENQLEGEVPFEVSNLTSLFMLDLSQNRLSGLVSCFNLSNMMYLYLQKNNFSGFIPFIWSEGSYLRVLDLRNNNFSGNIPYWMDKLSNLRVLSLGGNNFHGYIPIQLCQSNTITFIDLSHNKVNGSIPSCFSNLSFGMVQNNYDDTMFQFHSFSTSTISNSFSFDMPQFDNPISVTMDDEMLIDVEFRTKGNSYSYIGNILNNMTGMDLSCNMLTGIIPSQIGNLQQIHSMNLSHNLLSGFIPSSFSNLTQIESLDLSYNNLSGEIPSQLTQLNFLSIFNVSYNNLSGTPPNMRQFGSFDEENYRGNPGLCGPLLKRKCEGAPSQSSNSKEKETTLDMVAFTWSFCASFIIMLFGIIIMLYINDQWRMTWFYYVNKVIGTCFPSFLV